MDFAEARTNDAFAPGEKTRSSSPMLDVSKLQKIKFVVERIKSSKV